ncbi:MAG: hypothetical protein JNL67_00705 [Planctomycetaceae bacterium]|nr:hypothetical protein [Planctomycetaceae bacterium]
MTIQLLPYHHDLSRLLKAQDPEVWSWFAKNLEQPESVEAMKFELLKTTYRVDRETESSLYQAATEIAALLQINAPLTIYQAHQAFGLNASLVQIPGEVHIVLHGPIQEQLEPTELRALFGHEMTHYVLAEQQDQDLRIMDRMLSALAADRSAHPAYTHSLRLLRLYNEVLCDRGAFDVTRDVNAVVSLLLKLETGVKQINPAAFLKQAEEIFQRGEIVSQSLDHPELFIRAHAVRLWTDLGAESNPIVANILTGHPGLADLDLWEQHRVAQQTRELLDLLFSRPWFRTDATLAHAKLFFADYVPNTTTSYPQPLASAPMNLRITPDSMADYFSYLLLDFMVADRELEEAAFAWGLTLAEQIGVKERFVDVLRKELKLRKSQLDKIERNKQQIMSDAEHQGRAE